MAVTPGGNFYIQSSDLVANYPATSLAIANRLDKYALNPYTDATERDFLIQFPVQGQLAQTLDDNKAWKYDGTAWLPFSGAGPANFTDAATGTYTDGGVNYKYITFTGTGSITIDQAGFADMLVVGGGGGGGSEYAGGGGAGGNLVASGVYLPSGSNTVTVGAGGYSVGSAASGGSGESGLGNRGGGSGSFSGGGGGGAKYSGGLSDAGNGLANSITGTSVTRAGGGGGMSQSSSTGGTGGGGAGAISSGAGTNGTPNTGGGGGGSHAATGANGGSGIVIIRVVV